MKTLCLAIFIVLISSCSNNNVVNRQTGEKNETLAHKPAFQGILDSVELLGSILIFDPELKTFYSNDFEWSKSGKLPASTFKIPNSIIGLETGVIKDESTIFKWDGKKKALKNWEQDLVLKDAFQFSCVPCYQSVAREIGAKRMNEFLEKLTYGTMRFDSTSIDQFWLEGESAINQFEQISFLERLDQSQLPISKRTEEILKRIMLMEETNDYKIYGKTGWAVRDEIDNGWFVGFIIAKGKTYYFATNIEAKEQFNMDLFPRMRKEVTFKAMEEMGFIE